MPFMLILREGKNNKIKLAEVPPAEQYFLCLPRSLCTCFVLPGAAFTHPSPWLAPCHFPGLPKCHSPSAMPWCHPYPHCPSHRRLLLPSTVTMCDSVALTTLGSPAPTQNPLPCHFILKRSLKSECRSLFLKCKGMQENSDTARLSKNRISACLSPKIQSCQ